MYLLLYKAIVAWLLQHVPRINGQIPSVDEATSDHQRLTDRCGPLTLLSFCLRLYF